MASTVPKAFDEFEAKLRPTDKQQATIASRRSITAKYDLLAAAGLPGKAR